MQTTTLTLEPPPTWDDDYGLRLYEVYHDRFAGIYELFRKGVSGLCLGLDEPAAFDELFKVSDGVVSMPEHYRGKRIPLIANGSALSCEVAGALMKGRKIELVLRNTLSALIETDSEEGVGEVAVGLCYTLAKNDMISFKHSKPCFSLASVRLERFGNDFMVEIRVQARPGVLDAGTLDEDGEFDLARLEKAAGVRGTK
jgi:hypothetical protein